MSASIPAGVTMTGLLYPETPDVKRRTLGIPVRKGLSVFSLILILLVSGPTSSQNRTPTESDKTSQPHASVWAWGYNRYGQLGIGDYANRNTPAPVTSLTDIVAIAAGLTHSLALDNSGKI